jgi:hypothetical protein
MIAEIIPEAYDAIGRQVSQPFLRRKGPRPTFPIGRFVSQGLTVHCGSMDEVRRFLCGCRYISDEKLFGKQEYWQPPEEFEKLKAGDCEDFSLWTWRQLLEMGLESRVVFGKHGRYAIGHAWVMFFQNGRSFLLEPQARFRGLRLPRLSTLSYEPQFSVSWDGQTLRYYAHKAHSDFHPTWAFIAPLIPEWIGTSGIFWCRTITLLPFTVGKRIWRTKEKLAAPRQNHSTRL